MNDTLTFHPVISTPLLLAVGAVLLFILLFLEWRRSLRFRFWRMTAQAAMLLALLAMLLRPTYSGDSRKKGILLLTKGYEQETADSILSRNAELDILRTFDAQPYRDANVVSSFRQLPNNNALRFIVGDGLPLHALDLIREKNYQYFPGRESSGLLSLQAPTTVTVNKKHFIQGKLTGGKMLFLFGPGGAEDSVMISSTSSFRLTFLPRHTGRFLYHLIAKDSIGRTTVDETLRVTVLLERKLNIAILQEYPSGEIRYLKNFLSEKGHGITLRSRFSQNHFRYEFMNTPRHEVSGITTSWLDGFDLVIIDSDAFQRLAASERTALLTAEKNGLGILFLFNNVPSQVRDIKSFLPATYVSSLHDTTMIKIESRKFTLALQSEVVQDKADVIPVTRSIRGMLVAGYLFRGAGKSGFQFLTETYRLVLDGNGDSYAALWSPLIENIARSQRRDFTMTVLTPGPLHAGDPIDIEIISSGKTPTLEADSIAIPLTEDALLDDRWMGRTWLTTSGWHTVRVPGDSVELNLYVHAGDTLSSWGRLVQRQENWINAKATEKYIPLLDVIQQPISLWPFFVLFVVAGGFLWLAPKL